MLDFNDINTVRSRINIICGSVNWPEPCVCIYILVYMDVDWQKVGNYVRTDDRKERTLVCTRVV